jgi:hypothetical protein
MITLGESSKACDSRDQIKLVPLIVMAGRVPAGTSLARVLARPAMAVRDPAEGGLEHDR